MSLDEAGDARVEVSAPVAVSNQANLRFLAWLSQAGPAVLVRAGRANDGSDSVAVTDGGGERFDDDNTKPLAASVTVRPVVETVAHTVGREKAHVGQADGHV